MLLVPFAAGGAEAAPRLLGSFQDWSAYAIDDAADPSCYVVASPTKVDHPPGLARGAPFFLVTMRGGAPGGGEPSLIAGFPLMQGAPVKILVGDQRFTMFSRADGAWFKDPGDERRFIKALRGGTAMVVQGTAAKGQTAVDHYLLRGVNAALTAVEQACK